MLPARWAAGWAAGTLGVLSIAVGQVVVETVPVGDVGNAPDATGFGAVEYPFLIGKYEVTVAQYVEFLNAVATVDSNGLYHAGQSLTDIGCGLTRSAVEGGYSYGFDAEFRDRPVNFVSFWSACRFANWLHNGRPVGAQDESTTEGGAYTLTPFAMQSNSVVRNPSAKWAVPTENEWYKAAYYKAGSVSPTYWQYPTQSDVLPGRDLLDPTGNNANFYEGAGDYPIQGGFFTTVGGQFEYSPSPYGAFDMAGNLLELNETVIAVVNRGLRGGSYSGEGFWLRADYRWAQLSPTASGSDLGFRVAKRPCQADLIFDGLIDFADYLAFLNYYEAADAKVDYTEDGLVDFADYLQFLNWYGNSCEND